MRVDRALQVWRDGNELTMPGLRESRLIADRQARLKAERNDPSLRGFQRAREARRIVEESDKQIDAILTPD